MTADKSDCQYYSTRFFRESFSNLTLLKEPGEPPEAIASEDAGRGFYGLGEICIDAWRGLWYTGHALCGAGNETVGVSIAYI